MKVIDNLFVYGTLQKGKQHENILNNLNGNWKKGYVFGKLLNISSGPDYGYPALKLDTKGSKIYGMIFHSKNLESNIKSIDDFEGESYKRVISKIILEDGSQIDSYLYELKWNLDCFYFKESKHMIILILLWIVFLNNSFNKIIN